VQEYRGVYLVRGPAAGRDSVAAFALFGESMTAGNYLLGVLGVLMIFLAVSGAVTWWPGLRALAAGFTVRRGRSGYVRDLDLRRLVGILAVPFLLMWGVTGAAFFYQWPQRAYYAALPGRFHDTPEAPPPGRGPMLTLARATDVALAAHPGARVAGFTVTTPEQPGGGYGFRLARDPDPVPVLELLGCALRRRRQPRRRCAGLLPRAAGHAAEPAPVGRRHPTTGCTSARWCRGRHGRSGCCSG
jgi:uncharacterized iron-regulated membrane protein